MSTRPRTYVCVDGFNLYYRAVRYTTLKWLNIQVLAEQMLPHNDVLKVKYYTADIRSRGDPQKPLRQETFLRALRTLPKVEIYKGHFSLKKAYRELAQPDWTMRVRRWLGKSTGMNQRVKVYDPKEKGSDVNLAVHLVNDAWYDRFDVAVVLSNDNDLLEAIKIVRLDRGKKVGIINPHRDPNPQLHSQADFVRQLRAPDLVTAQFPDQILGTKIHKPTGW
jgi:uncharacterized LabA/DUF88 family protein